MLDIRDFRIKGNIDSSKYNFCHFICQRIIDWLQNHTGHTVFSIAVNDTVLCLFNSFHSSFFNSTVAMRTSFLLRHHLINDKVCHFIRNLLFVHMDSQQFLRYHNAVYIIQFAYHSMHFLCKRLKYSPFPFPPYLSNV